MPDEPASPGWWRNAVVYQVYPRSFGDSNGDGIGDLAGIRSHVDHLVELGVDAVWLSPFYPSALADGGYDIDDHRDVAPELGTLADFDAMTAALHAHGIRVIVDIVPNHTSDRHRWFRAALAAGPGSDERDRYVFREGRGPDGAEPPTDWESDFGGPAWTRLDDGWWYLHLFAPEQPDLNWDRRDVRDDFLATLRFWADRGVDGFRVDVANLLVKDLRDPLPSRAELTALTDGRHPYEDRDEVHEIYAEWRALFDSYDPPRSAVAEAWVPAHRRARYASPESLGQAFNFDLLTAPWEAGTWRRVIAENLDLAAQSGSTSTWVLSNHDVIRHPTRYGITAPAGRPNAIGYIPAFGVDPAIRVDRGLGAARARAATLLVLALPGSTYLYQGEELGLFEVVEIEPAQRQDPTFFRTGGTRLGRDGCRVPLPWTSEPPAFGFTPPGSAAVPHLPQPGWFAELSVERESGDPASSLTLYESALRLRRSLATAEGLTWVDSGPGVVHVVRPGGWHSVTNFGPSAVPLPEGEVCSAASPSRTACCRSTRPSGWCSPDARMPTDPLMAVPLHDPGWRGFASDNYAGVHPEVLEALAAANGGHQVAYGEDVYTRRLSEVVREHLGAQAEVFPVFNGTGGNVIGLTSVLPRWGAVVAADTAHIHTDEAGAPERVTGLKLLTVPTPDGKLTPELVEREAWGWGDEHRAQPLAVSITQTTELGTVYTPDEIRAVADLAHGHGMAVHLDGARIWNAAAALGLSFRDFTTHAGVDVLTFGGTKNGLLGVEAVVVLDPSRATGLVYLRKLTMQLTSKMRFASAQLLALFDDDLGLRSAGHANAMAARLRTALQAGVADGTLPGLAFTQETAANAVFATLPPAAAERIRARVHFYDWDRSRGEVRWMTAWDTTEGDVDAFVRVITEELARG